MHDDDEQFRRALGGLAGPPVDPYAALRELEPRLNSVRRRRVMTMGASLAAVAAAVTLAVGVAVATRHQAPPVKVVAPASDGSSRAETTASTAAGATSASTSPTTAASTTTIERTPSVSSESGVEETVEGGPAGDPSKAAGGGANHAPTASTQPARDASRPTAPGGGATSTSSAPAVSNAPAPTTTTTTAASQAPLRTATSKGGTVSYRFNGSSITDVQLSPAAGWVGSFERKESDRVDVVFRQDDHNASISLRVKDGRVEVNTEGGES